MDGASEWGVLLGQAADGWDTHWSRSLIEDTMAELRGVGCRVVVVVTSRRVLAMLLLVGMVESSTPSVCQHPRDCLDRRTVT